MDKRTFLKTSSALITGSMLAPWGGCTAENQAANARTNWAGNYTYSTDRLLEPKTMEELQTIVKSSHKIRALGSRHCFNDIADSRVSQVSLGHFQKMELDEEMGVVTVGSGVRYGDLAPFLQEKGYALHNLASLPHISVAGACSTGTHGSGVANGNLSTAVFAIEFIKANGEKENLSRAHEMDKFLGAVIGLGALGVITQISLDIEPTYEVSQHVYLEMPLTQLEGNLEAVLSSGYSVSLFTDWQQESINQVWIKRKTSEAVPVKPEWYGAKLADRDVHPIIEISPENCTRQMGVPGPWYDRLPHFKMGFTPSSGKELQTEFFVPRQYAWDAMMAIQKLGKVVGPLLMISELRTIDADDLWMSPCYQQSCMAIHFTWKQDAEALSRILPQVETALEPFEARPHWGKIFGITSAQLEGRYPRMADFQNLLNQFDPNGKFRNAYIERNIFGA